MSILSKLSSSVAVLALAAGLLAPIAFADRERRDSPAADRTQVERVDRNRQERRQSRENRRNARGEVLNRDQRVRAQRRDTGELRGGERRQERRAERREERRLANREDGRFSNRDARRAERRAERRVENRQELSAEASPKSDGCRIAFCTTINEEFGAIDLLKDIDDPEKYDRYLESDVPYLNISQTEVERIVRKHVVASPHIDLRLNHEWQSVETSADKTRSLVKDRSDNRTYEIEADWLIAADGAGSRVRQARGIEMIGPEKIQDFKNAYFELNLRDHIERPAKLYWIFEPAAIGTFIAHHIEKRWVYNVPIYEPWESPDDYTDEILAGRAGMGLEDCRRRLAGNRCFPVALRRGISGQDLPQP